MEFEVTAVSGFSAVLMDELDALEESAALAALEELAAPAVLEESAALDALEESTGASGGAAEEQATNINEEKIIRISAFQALAQPLFHVNCDKKCRFGPFW